VFTDLVLGFSLAHPGDLNTKEETFDLSEKGAAPAITQRILTFQTASGLPGMRIGVAPNPIGFSLEDWVSTYPGWPSEPSELVVAGKRALLFPINQLGEGNPVIYLEHAGYVYGIAQIPSSTNVNGVSKPVLSESDYQTVLDSLRLSP
jgi:hypothetical protein